MMCLKKKEWTVRGTFQLFMLLWFVINFLQAAYTGISNDEAYYALWGKQLDWGYFDHPPLVAVFNFLGSFFWNGVLGVRFVTVLAQLGTLIFTWWMINDIRAGKREVATFFLLASSLVVFVALGFVATPDAPLLLFSAFFLFAYWRFLEKEHFWNAMWLCISMAGMVYSKYQSSLVIGLVVLSNPRLLLNVRFWVAGFFALLLLSPHFYWQYSHRFPSLKYHLVDRNSCFQWRYFLEYIPNQLVVFNPFTLGVLIYGMVKYTWKDVFERGLFFLIIGIPAFFWIMSCRGHVEPHWTVVCSVPMLVLLYRYTKESARLRKFVWRYVAGSVVFILLIRVVLVTPLAGRFGFDKEKKYRAIEAVAGNLPVVFTGSFQPPSLYTFFSGKLSVTISSVYNRRTQFDVWEWEKKLENRPVFVCAEIDGRSNTYRVGDEVVHGFFVPRFHSAIRLEVMSGLNGSFLWHSGDTIRTSFMVRNPYSYPVDFSDETFPVEVCACFVSKKLKRACPVVKNIDWSALKPSESLSGALYFVVPNIPAGNYLFGVTVSGIFGPTLENVGSRVEIQQR